MNLSEASQKALHILADERVRPTISYVYVGTEWPHQLWWDTNLRQQGWTPRMAGVNALESMRKRKPREVEDNPKLWEFKSKNYNHLVTIFNSLLEATRPFLVGGLLNATLPAAAYPDAANHFPTWDNKTSNIALVTEFAVRTGNLKVLWDCTRHLTLPSHSAIIMLMELQEILALNFTQFSEEQIDAMPASLAPLYEIAERQSWKAKRSRDGKSPLVLNEHYRPGFEADAEGIMRAIDAIKAQCTQAKYHFVTGALQEGINLEIDTDKAKVQTFLEQLGFDPLLKRALDEAEKEYRGDATGFQLKSCLGHLRSFLEELHFRTCEAIAAGNNPESEYDKWGLTVHFLRKKDFLSSQEEKLVTGIHAIMSEDGVHPLIAEREYVRLLRNMVIEYGLLLLSILAKKGIFIQASTAQTTKGTQP